MGGKTEMKGGGGDLNRKLRRCLSSLDGGSGRS